MCPTSYCDLSGRSTNHFADGILAGDGLVKSEVLASMPQQTYTCTYNGQTTTLLPPARIVDKDSNGNELMDDDFPHYASSALAEIPPYPMGVAPIQPFIDQALTGNGGDMSKCPNINQIVGYHSGKNPGDELYQYWQLAEKFVLQDHMFEPVKSWSPVSHLYMVSAYSADQASCTMQGSQAYCPTLSYDKMTSWGSEADDHPWDNIADVLRGTGNTWKFYEGNGWDYQCQNCSNTVNPNRTNGVAKCIKRASAPNNRNTNSNDAIADFWSPLKHFKSVKENECNDGTVGCTSHVGDLKTFYTDLAAVTSRTDKFPSVSWIVPGTAVSEHGILGQVRSGVSYVTSIIQAVMRNPRMWDTTAIFVSWDDWGGFYDHFVPKKVDEAGWGIRVPGMLISKWAQYRYIDKDYYSHDAYLKLIEDLFAGSTKISQKGSTMRSDGRPSVREEAMFIEDPYGGMGDLLSEFDFNTGDPAVPNSGRKFITPSSDSNSIDQGQTYNALVGMKCCVDPCD